MLNKFLKREQIRGFVVYALYLILTILLQSLLFSRLEIFGVKGFILPAAVVCAGMYLGGVKGTVFGICLGILADMSFTDSTVLYTVLFSVIGFACGFLAEYYLNNSFFAFLLFGTAAMLLTGLAQFALAFFLYRAEVFRGLLTVLLQTLVSIPPAMLLYLPFRHRPSISRAK